ncbi:MAG: flagellar basal body rod protein FlgB [Candidatus Sericytochromatia bacterium]|nr:flagellar basal body rod protein FlgB [Candidatus Sericytochromatia bacterium]
MPLLESLYGNIPIIERALNGLSARQRALGENIANVDTPRFKRLEVAYEAQLRMAVKGSAGREELPMQTSNPLHFSLGPMAERVEDVRTVLTTVSDEVQRNDGNNVDIDAEMAKLAETNMRYNTMATLARNKFEGLKTMLREAR